MSGLNFNPNVTEKPYYHVSNQWGSNVRGVNGFGGGYTGGGSVETASGYSPRYMDNVPPLTKVEYNETIPSQAGYGVGESKFSIIA